MVNQSNRTIILYLQLLQEKLDFFPVGRAISLSHIDENETKKGLDELSAKVEILTQKIDKAEKEVNSFCRVIEKSILDIIKLVNHLV